MKREYNKSPNQTSFKKGHKPLKGAFGKGSIHSEQARKKISKSLYGKRGKFARRWKGSSAGYTAIHLWVRKHRGKPAYCENLDCLGLKSARFEWASISGECKRMITDYMSLCTRCHRKFDNGNLIIRTEGGNIEREKILEAKCPNCKSLFEIKL